MGYATCGRAARRRAAAVAAAAAMAAVFMSGCGSRVQDVPDTLQASSEPQATASPWTAPGDTVEASGDGQAVTGWPDADDAGTAPSTPAPPVIAAEGAQQAPVTGNGPDDGGASQDAEHGPSDAGSGRASVTYGDLDGLPDGFHLAGMSALGIEGHGDGSATVLHDGKPFFDVPAHPYDTATFSALDDYGRAGPAYACVSMDTADPDARPAVPKWDEKPSGWQGTSYRGPVPGGYLWHKCELIPRQLYDSRTSMKNIVSVTQHMHDEGLKTVMAAVSEHLSRHGGHVALRVTPVYAGTHAVCDGVLVEAASIGGEYAADDEDGPLEMCLFLHNVQPGVEIDYTDGRSSADGSGWDGTDAYGNHDYVLDMYHRTFHEGPCSAVAGLLYSRREEYRGQRDDLLDNRFEACGICMP